MIDGITKWLIIGVRVFLFGTVFAAIGVFVGLALGMWDAALGHMTIASSWDTQPYTPLTAATGFLMAGLGDHLNAEVWATMAKAILGFTLGLYGLKWFYRFTGNA